MKIIKVEIENFGKLSNYKLDFSEKLTEIVEDNGWGKTTLTDFIKVMFYGLLSNRKHKITENYRKKYKPWQGGVFGGSLEFEFNKNNYKVTRTFGTKQSEDYFEIMSLKTNKPLEYYPGTKTKIADKGNSLGCHLLGLNDEAFNRTVFLSQNSATHEISSANINEKLSNLLGGDTEKYDFKKAIKKIKTKRSKLSNRNKTGEIDELKIQVISTEKQIEENKTHRKQMMVNYKQIKEVSESIKTYSDKLNEIKKKINLLQKNSEILNLQKNIKEAEGRLNNVNQNLKNIIAFFNNKQPQKNDIDNLNSLINKLEYKKQNNAFENKLKSLNKQLDEYEQFFAKKLPSDNEVSELQENIFSYNSLTVNQSDGSQKSSASNKKTNKSFIIGSTIVSAVVLLVLAFVAISWPVLAVSIFVPYFLFYVGTYAYLHIKNKNSGSSSLPLKSDKNNQQIKTVKQKIELFLLLFYNDLNNKIYSELAREISNKLNEYNNLKQSHKQAEKEFVEFNEKLQNLNLQIEKMLEQFNVEHITSYSDIKEHVNAQFASYNSEIRLLREREEDYNKLKSKLKNIESQNVSLPSESLEELQASEEKIDNIIAQLSDDRTKLETLNISLENASHQLPLLETELDELNGKILEKDYEFKVLRKTEHYLHKAEESITSKYIAPIKTQFVEMANQIFTEDFSEVVIDSQLQIKMKNYGVNYEFDFYSAGYKDIMNLIMRLSLASVLFENTKPFVVLDDPFTNADAKKLEKALSVLKTISSNFQVIYLTCHNSRATQG